jgi:hypothetical protein
LVCHDLEVIESTELRERGTPGRPGDADRISLSIIAAGSLRRSAMYRVPDLAVRGVLHPEFQVIPASTFQANGTATVRWISGSRGSSFNF